ncbi:hypothetical protein GLUCOINTEAF2_0200652 [Komagataeibacter intermedius AF2]|uniref:Uncharacterized protein n=1 Tax=Komagataeibacter intermedius AF2 TaxID=1458464 RepID=A0A0N0MFG3_9PROT|nr:hypothetical protein GLUCOINTEAF2_0200652 [Komagataeibacter intermedius AF2]
MRRYKKNIWYWFCSIFLATIGAAGGCLYLFVVLVDPWGGLPLPLHRLPVTGNARFTMPMLARDGHFDSVMLGTSTGRLMQPAVLDGPKQVPLNPEPWPDWMYQGTPWMGYLHMANLYALQEAANQFMLQVGLRHDHYGADGYTSFVGADSTYTRARADRLFVHWGPDHMRPPPGGVAAAPAMQAYLPRVLHAVPDTTLRIVWFPPVQAIRHNPQGSMYDSMFAACHRYVASVAGHMPNTLVIDFDIPGPIVDNRDMFWDPIHYRLMTADRIMGDMIAAVHDRTRPSPDYIIIPSPCSGSACPRSLKGRHPVLS